MMRPYGSIGQIFIENQRVYNRMSEKINKMYNPLLKDLMVISVMDAPYSISFFPLLELGTLNLQSAFTNVKMTGATTIRRRRSALSPTTSTKMKLETTSA
jgi:hypothetical protein